MIQTWASGRPKYKAADELILSIMDSIYAVNDKVEFSLRVFGHQHTVAENYCYDTKNEVWYSKQNRTQMDFRLSDIKPLGVTPIAYSLQQAAQYDLVDEQKNAYSIILITDGGESCGGDICAVMQSLIKNKVYFKPYIVSLEDFPGLRNTYSCMGDYLQVTKDGDIPVAVNTIVSAFRPIIKLTPTEYKKIVANAPSILKVNVPVVTVPDTAKAIKTFKDSVIAPKPVKIKVEDAPPPRPKADKVSVVALAARRPLFIAASLAPVLQKRNVNIVLPTIAEDAPPPPPPVIRPAPVKLNRLSLAPRKNFNTYTEYNSPKINLPPLRIGALPPLVIDIAPPPPPPVVRPAPVQLAGLSRVPRRSFDIPKTQVAAITKTLPARSLPPLIIDIAPAPPPPVVRPEPAKLSRLSSIKRTSFDIPKTQVAAITKTLPARNLPPLIIDITPAPPPPVMRAAPEKVSRLLPVTRKSIDIPKTQFATIIKSLPTRTLPPLVIDLPAPAPPPPPPAVVVQRPATVKMSRTALAKPKPVAIEPKAAPRMKTVRERNLPALVFDIPAPPAPTPPPVAVQQPRAAGAKVAKLALAKRVPFNVVFVIEEGNIKPVKLPKLPPVKIDLPPLPAGKPSPAMTGSPNINVEVIEAKETSVEIYLTNGKGKFYVTSPQVSLTEVATQKPVKTFYRTVDPDGNPDPQPIVAGTYNLSFPKKKDLVKNNIKIEANKKTKIYVTVKPVSLSFGYYGAPDRQVKEFGARVIERNKVKGRVQDQRCTEQFEYEPGNYHVRINTFPEEVRNVDLDIDGEYIMRIDQPGFAKFTAENKQTVTLWMEDGDKFKPFHQLDLNDPRSQHLQIQPGRYQVHYRKGPGGPSVSEKVKAFMIIGTKETEIIID